MNPLLRTSLPASGILLSALLVASAGIPAGPGTEPTVLQDQEETPKPAEKEAREIERPPRERQAGDAKKVGEARKAGESAGAEKGPAARGKPDAAVVKRKLALEERKHRERLAKIARLRELAVQKNQERRIAALDELQRKETERYGRVLTRAQEALGGEFGDVQRKLAKGRAPGRGIAGKGPAGKQAAREKRAAGGKGQAGQQKAQQKKGGAGKPEKDAQGKQGKDGAPAKGKKGGDGKPRKPRKQGA